MRIIGSKDIASLALCGKLGESSLSSLSLLYSPLLGVDGVGFYLLLYGVAASTRSSLSFEALSRQSGLTLREIDGKMRPLEALGLLKTYLSEEGEARAFSLFVYPPHSPKAFFDDLLCSGKFRERVGEENYASTKRAFFVKPAPEKAREITASFEEVFGEALPNMDRGFLGGEEDGPAKSKTGFDVSAFAEGFSGAGAALSLLSQEELGDVEKAHALYGYDSRILGEFAADCLRYAMPFGQKLDRAAFLKKCQANFSLKYLRPGKPGKSEIQGEGDLSKKAQMLDSMSPARYLAIKQRGHKPAGSDLRLLNRLVYEIGLPAPAVNALLDYVLETNNGVLNGPLAEKIAASLVRKGIDNARDAMDDLYATKAGAMKRLRQGKAAVRPAEEASAQCLVEEASAQCPAEEESDEELNALLEALYGKKE